MVKSMVNSCLPEFSDFTRVFSPVKVVCNGPLECLQLCHITFKVLPPFFFFFLTLLFIPLFVLYHGP